MNRADLITRLKQAEPRLRANGVAALYLFGSYARDEARTGSDVDVFVEPISDDKFDFLKYMDAYDTIKHAVGEGLALGYSTRDGLSPYILDDVDRKAIRIF